MHWTYQVQEDGLTIEQLLRTKWQLPKKPVHELRMAKGITDADGEPLRWNVPLPAGTLLQIDWPGAESPYVPENTEAVPVLFEDEHLLIVMKPKGMPTHPNEPGQTGTCANAVMGHIQKQGGRYAEHIHRLDQGTSGLVLFAKHPAAKSLLDRMLEERRIVREYKAEVSGRVRLEEGTISAAIGRDRHHPTRRRVSPGGQQAITHYRTIRRGKATSLLHLTLDTGRTHQIRVHLAHIGHPIIGDDLYGGPVSEDGTYKLHAFRMRFVHPFTGEEIEVNAK